MDFILLFVQISVVIAVLLLIFSFYTKFDIWRKERSILEVDLDIKKTEKDFLKRRIEDYDDYGKNRLN